MDTCDVLIVGGGPAGSSCAWKLRRAGADVLVVDQAVFPRDKVCAGWITPQVIEDLQIDCADYRRGRTFQTITGFRTDVIGGGREVETTYDRPVSYGIRRCEFDQYLLRRSAARLDLGTRISSIRRERGYWVVNESIKATMLVGAGGHFCPVARWLNPASEGAAVVVAQEAEFPIPDGERSSWTTAPERPELYFCRDLKGYGWSFRKGDYLNVGLGRLDSRSLPRWCAEFIRFLQAHGKVPAHASWRWRGHAYLVCEPPHRKRHDEGVALIGDSAGLAYSQSGEGIRPSIESGLLAAATILEANGRYSRPQLERYVQRLQQRFVVGSVRRRPAPIGSGVATRIVPWLLETRWFVRNVVLDRWFLHAN